MLIRFVLCICLCLFFNYSCFAYMKQTDEFSCGAVSAYNLINNFCKDCGITTDLNLVIKMLKTNKNGTTTYNLCNGLNKFLDKQNINHELSYYGIKKVRRYKTAKTIDFEKIEEYISQGYAAILNIGIYEKKGDYYIRQYGHYVNLISVNKEEMKVFDPYDKENEFLYWKTQTKKANLKNINDNEKYEKADDYIFITTPVNYCKPDEYIFINGIIIVKLKDRQ